ncbi:hypothetical protein ANN_15887 [Periplaneta americana]|uniref:Uncharacterized protein n=1 Tax=Periplaneta americana TaxID=6978 RepID=A0ABQ8SHP1_PERAM|nr:hypothetical protein ANN_15887 [Periplaneta americana]
MKQFLLSHVPAARLGEAAVHFYEFLLHANCFSDRNVEELVLFPGQKPSRMLSYGGKQLISREVELEKMRRAEAKLQAGSENTQEKKEEAKENEKGKGKEVSSPATLPNHLQVLQPKVVNAEMVSFYIRFI